MVSFKGCKGSELTVKGNVFGKEEISLMEQKRARKDKRRQLTLTQSTLKDVKA